MRIRTSNCKRGDKRGDSHLFRSLYADSYLELKGVTVTFFAVCMRIRTSNEKGWQSPFSQSVCGFVPRIKGWQSPFSQSVCGFVPRIEKGWQSPFSQSVCGFVPRKRGDRKGWQSPFSQSVCGFVPRM
jgi:hypothetical protein